jgi:hypothetical protein
VARKGDGWLSRGMGGYVGGRMANLVVRPLASMHSGFEFRNPSKIIKWAT